MNCDDELCAVKLYSLAWLLRQGEWLDDCRWALSVVVLCHRRTVLNNIVADLGAVAWGYMCPYVPQCSAGGTAHAVGQSITQKLPFNLKMTIVFSQLICEPSAECWLQQSPGIRDVFSVEWSEKTAVSKCWHPLNLEPNACVEICRSLIIAITSLECFCQTRRCENWFVIFHSVIDRRSIDRSVVQWGVIG